MTIGETIQKLIVEYGQSTLGIYCLERALAAAVGGDEVSRVLVDKQLPSETARYRELWQREQEIIDRLSDSLYTEPTCPDCGQPLTSEEVDGREGACGECRG